jgi:tetratricopeptide (TPR) repeat protein
MKRLFKFLLFAGIVTAVVVYVTNASRKRATGTQAPENSPWAPPTLEPSETYEPEPVASTNGAVPAGEPAVAPAEEPEGAAEAAEAIEEAVAEAEMLDEAEAAELFAEALAEDAAESLQDAIAEDEGMPPPPGGAAEDIALDAEGDLVISELAEPGEEEEFLEAVADAEAMEEVAALAEAEAEAEMMAEAEAGAEAITDAAAALAEPVTIDAQQESEEASPPEAGVVVLDTEQEPAERDVLTEAFEQLAATPEPAIEAEAILSAPEAAPNLFSSVEEALDDLEPAPIVPPPRRTAESFLDEGNVYFNVGQYGLAIERYGQAIALDDQLTAAYYNRANAHTRAGEFEKALGDYDRALDLHPLDADALNNRGMLHLYRTNYAAALADFNRALDIDSSDTTVMVNRGLAQLHGGNAAAALVDFREAAQMDQSDAAAQYGAAQAAATMGNREEAFRHIGRALELDPAYAREAAADPRLAILSGDEEFLKLLRQTGPRAN